MQRAAAAVATHRRQEELLPLDQLANALGVHLKTLQAAARTGRPEVHFRVRSALDEKRTRVTPILVAQRTAIQWRWKAIPE